MKYIEKLKKYLETKDWVECFLFERICEIDSIIRKAYDFDPEYRWIATQRGVEIYDGNIRYSYGDDYRPHENYVTREFPLSLLESEDVEEDATAWAKTRYSKQLEDIEARKDANKNKEINRLLELVKKYPDVKLK